MPKTSHRERILAEGLLLVHKHGFARTSVRDIVAAAGVPQGSFTNHFVSKEAFGLEILERYYHAAQANMAETLRDDARPALARLRAYIDGIEDQLNRDNMRCGCLFGNFTAEASDHSEPIRRRVVAIFGDLRESIAYCLRAAVAAGEVNAGLDCDDVAGFVLSSLEGAILLSKAYRSPEPIERFKRVLFDAILAP